VRVLIAGAGGLSGTHLAQRFASGYEVIALKHRDLAALAEYLRRAAV